MRRVAHAISVAIITAPRMEIVIDRSLETYFLQKLPFPHVFAEPGAGNFYYKSQVVLHSNSKQLGCFLNWWYAAQWMLHNTKSDYVLLCEDDIHWAVNAYSLVEPVLSKDHVITAWTPYVSVNIINGTGWHPVEGLGRYGLCGSLALFFPRLILAEVLYHRIMTCANRIHLDTDIGFTLEALKIPIINHSPSLVTHLGAYNSTFDLSVVGENTIDARRCYDSCSPNRR